MAASDSLHSKQFHGTPLALNIGDEIKRGRTVAEGRWPYLHHTPFGAKSDAETRLRLQKGQTQLFGSVYESQRQKDGTDRVTGFHSFVLNPNAVASTPIVWDTPPQPKSEPVDKEEHVQETLF